MAADEPGTTTPLPAPRVFLSHASADKDRFVRPFAMALRAKGLEVWVDEWEIRLGESLPEKIFEQGIGGATTLIIVLSAVSMTREWVRAELDAAVVLKIEGRLRIIPVVLDKADVPVSLKATKWRAILDTNEFGDVVTEIVDTIFQKSIKPPLGKPPAYVSTSRGTSGLDAIDALVLKALGDAAVGENSLQVRVDDVAPALDELGVVEARLRETIQVLFDDRLLEDHSDGGTRFPFVQFTSHGFEKFLATYFSGYATLRERIEAAIVNTPNVGARALAHDLSTPGIVIEHVFFALQSDGAVKLSPTHSDVTVWEVSPKLNRRVAAR